MTAPRSIPVRATRTLIRTEDADFTIVILQGTPGEVFGADTDGTVFITWAYVLTSTNKVIPTDGTVVDAGILADYPEEGVRPEDLEVVR